MRKKTTTRQLNAAITDKLLYVTSAQKYHKSTRQSDVINADTFKDSLDFICESAFRDCIGWHYERNHETGDYEVDCGRMNPDSDVIVIAHLCANEGVDRESVDRALIVIED